QPLAQRVDEQPQALTEGPCPQAASRGLPTGRRLGATLLCRRCHPAREAAVFALQLGKTRERSREAEQRPVAGVNAGDEGIDQGVGDLIVGAAAGKGVDRLVGEVGARTAEPLVQQSELPPPAQHAAAQEREKAGWQLAESAL